MSNSIVDIRKQLHAHPGVSGCEHYAHDLIVAQLRLLSPTALYDHVGGYGVIALWSSSGSAPTIAFRADIDALPIGHRCGHDGHAAIMLRFAQVVDAFMRKEVTSSSTNVSVMLIFQPEEETGTGAAKIVQSGIMQRHNVKAVYGLHNLPGFREGEVVLIRHTFAAASCGVIYRLIGRPTHASTPEKGINPGRAAAAIIERMDGLNKGLSVARSTLICCRVGEEAFGTSAGQGEVMFTLRSFTNEAMLSLIDEADAIAAQEAQRWTLGFEKQVCEPFRATENTPQLVDRLKSVFQEEGIPLTVKEEPFRWSEDFAEYLRVFPGAFFGIGSGENQPELHHPSYNFPDSIIEPAAYCFELIMKSYCNNHENI